VFKPKFYLARHDTTEHGRFVMHYLVVSTSAEDCLSRYVSSRRYTTRQNN